MGQHAWEMSRLGGFEALSERSDSYDENLSSVRVKTLNARES